MMNLFCLQINTFSGEKSCSSAVVENHRVARGLGCFFLILLVVFAAARPAFPASVKETAASVTELGRKISRSAALEDLIRFAYARNPSIQVARESWRATIEGHRVATGYPDPQLSATYFPQPIETRLGPQDWNATLSQKIPFPGKLSKAGEVETAKAKIARLKLDKAYRDVVVAIRESYYELQYIRDAGGVAEQNMALLDHLRKVSETGFAQDRSTLLDVTRAQSQVGQLRYDILLLQELEQTEIATINGLLNRHPGAQIGPLAPTVPAAVVYPLEEIYALAEKHQEEIRIADAIVEKAEKATALARYNTYPEFKVGLFYAGIGDPDVASPPPDAGDDAFGIQAGITIPLWSGKNRGRVARARAEERKAVALKTRRVNQTRTRIRAIWFKLENAGRLIDLYRNDLVPQAAKSMALAETWFRQRESAFSDFIESQAVWYNFQLALARATADHGKTLARLERLAGTSLTHKRNDMESPSGEED